MGLAALIKMQQRLKTCAYNYVVSMQPVSSINHYVSKRCLNVLLQIRWRKKNAGRLPL